jgi:hypothetical protein
MSLTVAPGASPALVRFARELATIMDRYNENEDGPYEHSEVYKVCGRIFADIEKFAPRNIADVLMKARAGEVYYGEGIPKDEDDCLTAGDRILLQMITDLDRLAAAG